MMSVEFEVSRWIPATPEEVYDAWLDSGEHTRMTGSRAVVSGDVGGTLEAWDGYIQGRNVELERPGRILQEWRTRDFGESDGDSLLEVLLKPQDDGTLVTICHSNLPDDGMQYKQGWVEAYFEPMAEYFGAGSQDSSP
jgi:uncharacterized protein YndB with AHSA1/START domain